MYTAAIPPFGSVTAEDVSYDAAPGYPPGTDNVQEALDYLAGATVASMTPTVEGVAFGETSAGRTLLGFGVDAGSNNVGLWASSTGAAQNPSNSGAAVTAFFDTDTNGATMLNGVYLGAEGSVKGSNLSNSLMVQRNSLVEDQADWTESLLMLYDFTANSNDRIKNSIALITGQFSTDSNWNESILIGDMTGVDSAVISDALCIRTPGSTSNLTMANNTGYIGNGQSPYVMNAGDFLIEAYERYYLKTLRFDNTSGQIAYYEPVSGELTYGPEPAAYILPAKQPNTLGGSFGVNSAANASEVNGRNSFNNYSAGPPQLTGVTAVGQQLYQASVPASNGFVNDIFLGRSHQFPGATSITNTLIAASIVGNGTISQITDCNMIVPRASSLTFNYVGAITGACFHSSGSVACFTDPLYASVLSSGGTTNPGQANLVLSSAPAANSIIMQGQGNTLIQSSSAAITYNHSSFNNCCTINSGTTITLPTSNSQFCCNHSTLRMPNVLAVGTAGSTTSPMAFDSATGLISPTLSPLLSRVYRAVGTTTGAGQVVFTPGSGVNPSTVGYAFNATVRDASTTVAHTCSIVAVSAVSVTVQVFQSVLAAVGSPTMVAAGAGIITHFSMCY